jgi:hypothetical protein
MDAAIDTDVKLTAKERRAVADLTRALRRLPRGIHVRVTREGAIVMKTVSKGYAGNIALLPRRTLHFGI